MTGVGIDVPASKLNITDNDLNFGTIETDKTSNKTLTLTNAGGDGYPAINVFAATISNDGTGAFTTNFANNVTIEPGQSTQIAVSYTHLTLPTNREV